LRLACVGRIDPKEKGQDLVLRVLARERWRERPVDVSFFGNGGHVDGLKAMAEFHRLSNVSFHGFVKDVTSIWNAHHALLLPSRCEGLPLVIVEAMLHGRVPIVTNVAGNGEVIENDRTGFLAAAPTEDALDHAMERAWRRRNEWPEIGANAAEAIRAIVPRDPAAVFAATLENVARSIE
jgi:glycosyltransferase involved in cell wall biosynthesis